MAQIFTRTFRVRFAEVGANGTVGPANYLRYLVETAYDWGEAGGFGAAGSEQLGLAWVIRETEFTFFHPLRHNDVFDFTIWMLDWKRVRGYRAYQLHLKNSRTLVAQGVQQLVSLDSASLRPTIPPESIMSYYRLEQPQSIPHQDFPRLPEAPTGAYTATRAVEQRDLDSLGHVNNAVYMAYAEEAVWQACAAIGYPPERMAAEQLVFAWRSALIQYQNPAYWGQRLEVETYLVVLDGAGGRWAVVLQGPERLVALCLLDWQLMDRSSGASRPLPQALATALAQVVSAKKDQ